MKNFIAVKTCFLATMLLGIQCASASEITSAEAGGTCTLTNVKANKVIYEGRCIIDEAIESDGRTTWFLRISKTNNM